MSRLRSAVRRGLRALGGAPSRPVAPPASRPESDPRVSSTELPEWLRNKILKKFAQRYIEILDARRAMAASGAPILIGPWMSEVGHELLYWVPMLRFLQHELKWDPERAVVITRGGAAIWYEGLAARSCDLFDLMSVEEYRALNEQRWRGQHGAQKQKRITDLDRQAIALAAARLGIDGYETLHPTLMYRSLNLYWNGVLGLNWYGSLTRLAPLRPPALPPGHGLPDDYFAVKFYVRPSFPDTVANRLFIRDLVRHLARSKPVVLIEDGQRYDEHEEHRLEADEARVIRFAVPGRPADNLAVQTAVIARSAGFYGTYGGLCYLPMHFDVPATGFVSEPDQVLPLHETAAEHACARFRAQHGYGRARVRVLTTQEAAALAQMRE